MSVACVERELDAIKAAGTATHLYFMDDTFNVPKKRFQEILRMMIRNQYNFKWKSFYRSDHGDEETIALMQESGCWYCLSRRGVRKQHNPGKNEKDGPPGTLFQSDPVAEKSGHHDPRQSDYWFSRRNL